MTFQEGQLDYNWLPEPPTKAATKTIPGYAHYGQSPTPSLPSMDYDKPSAWQRIGSALGQLFSHAAEAARIAGPAILDAFADIDFSVGNPYQTAHNPDFLPSGYRPRDLPRPTERKRREVSPIPTSPRLMEAAGKTLDLIRTGYKEQLSDLLELNQQAARRSNAAQAFAQHYALPDRREAQGQSAPVDDAPSTTGNPVLLVRALEPGYGQASTPISSTTNADFNLQFGQKPISYQQLPPTGNRFTSPADTLAPLLAGYPRWNITIATVAR